MATRDEVHRLVNVLPEDRVEEILGTEPVYCCVILVDAGSIVAVVNDRCFGAGVVDEG